MEAIIIGEVNERHSLGRKLHYFHERGAWLDLRGYVDIDPTAHFGFGVKIITASHRADWLLKDEEDDKRMVLKRVDIGARVWVCSFAVLFNCKVEEGAVVGCGAVVCNQTVEKYTMVAGNPAEVVKRWNGDEWVRV